MYEIVIYIQPCRTSPSSCKKSAWTRPLCAALCAAWDFSRAGFQQKSSRSLGVRGRSLHSAGSPQLCSWVHKPNVRYFEIYSSTSIKKYKHLWTIDSSLYLRIYIHKVLKENRSLRGTSRWSDRHQARVVSSTPRSREVEKVGQSWIW